MPQYLADLRAKQIRILLLEDNPGDVGLFLDASEKAPGVDCTIRVESRLANILELRNQQFDIILLDLNIPGSEGIETLTTVRMIFPRLPVVLVTGVEDRELIEEAFSQGAQEYLLKGSFSPRELSRVLLHAIERHGLLNRLHESKEQLQANQDRLQTIITNSLEGILVVDQDGHIKFSNPAAQDILGHSAETLKGRGFGNRLRDGQVEVIDIYKSETGNHAVEMSVRQLVWEGRDSFLLMLRDITEKRRLEIQLKQSQKMEALGCLSGGIAHEFNNLLSVVSGYCELLQNELRDMPSAKRKVDTVLVSTRRAADLIKQLASYTERTIGDLQALDLTATMKHLIEMLDSILPANIKVTRQLAAELPMVMADAHAVEQSITQMVINARDAMPHGGRLHLRSFCMEVDQRHVQEHPEAREGLFICITVSDTGVGISPSNLGRVFDPFFTTKPEDEGTGLGLTSVFGVVQQHDGWVEVTSELGKGSAFTVYLPVYEEPEEHHASEEPADEGSVSILLVEDEEDLLILNGEFLSQMGYEVYSARTGDEALSLWNEHKGVIDLLLSDFVMPGTLTGRQLADIMVAEKPDLKVLLTSGYQRDLGSDGGSDVHGAPLPFLLKPYSMNDLAKTIRHCLEG